MKKNEKNNANGNNNDDSFVKNDNYITITLFKQCLINPSDKYDEKEIKRDKRECRKWLPNIRC